MDNATVIADITTALQDMCALAGVPSPMDQVTTLTAANAQLTTDKAALQTKYDNYVAAARAAATADKAQDDAREAGQDVLDIPT